MMKQTNEISLAEKIKADAKKAIKKCRESPEWLQKDIPFEQDYYLEQKLKTISDILFDSLNISFGYKEEEKKRDFEILIANLLRYGLKKPTRISLNQNDWKHTRYNRTSYFTLKECINILIDNKLINMKKGYKTEMESYKTRIWATEELLKLFPKYREGVVCRPLELVILRDSKGKSIEYKDNDETRRIRKILQQANEINGKAHIRFKSQRLTCTLFAIFKEKLTWYGRLHTRGYSHYQGLSGEERKEITINGESTVELDFRGLHPNLLYASIGKQLNEDPYSIVDKRPEVRPFLKMILLCMIDSKNEVKAESAANNWLRGYSEGAELKSLGITRARPLMKKFLDAHKPIAHFFFKGRETGLRIMNKDSKIALEVINHFVKKDVPILSIHDSFIVQEQFREELLKVMVSSYKKYVNGFSIEVK